ncbi:hypothetical protein [Kribbella sp. CA-247076]|uniref:hypothetical protein n=1 Tax=Kribbella sp. CA-247076 TaxID=3239941 RepID=UPI003D900656
MTDDLKHKFEQLVADPPAPSGVPSEKVAAQVRAVRRRRTAGAVTLAAAAVAAVAVAAGNLTDLDSSPPVTTTPSTSPTAVTTPTIVNTPKPYLPMTSEGSKTPKPGTVPTTGAGATSPTIKHTPPPAQPPIDVDVVLKPTVEGRTVTMRITVSGTVVRPTTVEGRALPADTSFVNLSGGTDYTWGDQETGGSDAGAVTCEFSKKRSTGRETYSIPSHTYTKPGTYTFRYTVRYCGADGTFETSETAEVVVR